MRNEGDEAETEMFSNAFTFYKKKGFGDTREAKFLIFIQ